MSVDKVSKRDRPSYDEDLAPVEVATAWREGADEHGFPDPLLDLIATRFRLLGEPLRLKLLGALASSERSVSELVTLTGANQPNVSRHLAALSQGGLVSRRKAGTTIYYSLADSSVLALCDAVCSGIQDRIAAQAHALGIGPNKRPTNERFTAPAHRAPEDGSGGASE